jgi:hypothetical protein
MRNAAPIPISSTVTTFSCCGAYIPLECYGTGTCTRENREDSEGNHESVAGFL